MKSLENLGTMDPKKEIDAIFKEYSHFIEQRDTKFVLQASFVGLFVQHMKNIRLQLQSALFKSFNFDHELSAYFSRFRILELRLETIGREP